MPELFINSMNHASVKAPNPDHGMIDKISGKTDLSDVLFVSNLPDDGLVVQRQCQLLPRGKHDSRKNNYMYKVI